MSLPPLDSVPLIPRLQTWLHRRHYGQVLSPIRWWGRTLWLSYLALLFMGYIERHRSPLNPVPRSLVSARIAQLCHCEFYIDITSMTLAVWNDGQDKLLAVADWRSSTLFSEREYLALACAEATTQTPPEVDDALRNAMVMHLDARTLTKLTALISLQNLSARLNATMAIPAQGLCQMSTSPPQSEE